MTNAEEQQSELLAIKSIFDENTFEIFDSSNKDAGRFVIDVEAPVGSNFSLLVNKTTEKNTQTTVNIEHLSPLYLTFSFPNDYPSASAPSYRLNALWLTPTVTKRIDNLLEREWRENVGSPILFSWYQLLKDSTYEMLDQPIPLGDCGAPVDQLLDALTDYDRLRRRRIFETSYFNCAVCCGEFLGSDCEVIPLCGHIFCRECCRQYLTVQVNDGAIERLTCLAENCKTPITGHQLLSILGADLYARYDRLALSRGLDSMTDVVQCPRPDCGAPVLTEGPESNMARCAVCSLPFCIFCRKVFHGIAPCSFAMRDKKRILKEYTTADGAKKLVMEQRYGKQTLQRMMNESMSEEWIGEHSKPCPHCRISIEKNDGCNKMSCAKCGTYFCWLCMHTLNPNNPYDHFNDPSGKCFNSLFVGVTIDEGDGMWPLR